MEPRWTIYSHTHVASGRRYVGLTKKTMLFRWNQHIQNAKAKRGKGCVHFWAAIRKYGKDAFSHEVLEICDTIESANAAEERLIRELETRNPEKGFNLARGGLHFPSHGGKNPWDRPEFREKMIMVNAQTMSRPEVRRKIGDAARGRVFSAETRRKISENNVGKTIGPEAAAKISATMKAKDWSWKVLGPETRRKISEAVRGRKTSQATKDRISASGRARPRIAHCKRGHEYAPENTFLNRNGARECRTCIGIRRALKKPSPGAQKSE
jgi:group I intron endonuclease